MDDEDGVYASPRTLSDLNRSNPVPPYSLNNSLQYLVSPSIHTFEDLFQNQVLKRNVGILTRITDGDLHHNFQWQTIAVSEQIQDLIGATMKEGVPRATLSSTIALCMLTASCSSCSCCCCSPPLLRLLLLLLFLTLEILGYISPFSNF